MPSRKHGMWVNYSDEPAGGSSSVVRVHLGAGTISTCFTLMNEPVLTNGKIGSVSDTVTVEPRTSLTQFEHDPA
jgi:hypothetical protein